MDGDVERVRRAIDLVELIGSYVPLRRSGKSMSGLCPFHEERTPSFHVFPESQLFKCFGCNTAGDCFSFLMKRERQSFREALEALAERAGVKLERFGGAPRKDGLQKKQLFDALDAAAKFFSAGLERAPASLLQGLDQRGLHEEIRREWSMGLAPSGWQTLRDALHAKGFNDEVLLACGLVTKSDSGRVYDRFRDRVTFPIRDAVGRVIAFGARLLPGVKEGEETGPKYLNSPECEVFSKRHVLYGLDRLRNSSSALGQGVPIVVMEGYTDVILAHSAGMRTAVATLGTALGSDHAKLLRRYSPKVLLLYDGDEAGLRASERGVALLLEEGLEVRIAELPDGLDPADHVLARGAADFLATVGDGVEFFEFLAKRILSRTGAHASPADWARACDEVLRVVARVPSPLEREILVRRVAQWFALPEPKVAQRLASLAHARPERNTERTAQRVEEHTEAPAPAPAFDPLHRMAAEELLGGLLRDPSLLALVHASRFLPSQIAFLGYNYVLEAALQCAAQGSEADVQAVSSVLGDSPFRDVPASLWASAPENPEQAVTKALAYFKRREAEVRIATLKRELARAEALQQTAEVQQLRQDLLAWQRAYRGGTLPLLRSASAGETNSSPV